MFCLLEFTDAGADEAVAPIEKLHKVPAKMKGPRALKYDLREHGSPARYPFRSPLAAGTTAIFLVSNHGSRKVAYKANMKSPYNLLEAQALTLEDLVAFAKMPGGSKPSVDAPIRPEVLLPEGGPPAEQAGGASGQEVPPRPATSSIAPAPESEEVPTDQEEKPCVGDIVQLGLGVPLELNYVVKLCWWSKTRSARSVSLMSPAASLSASGAFPPSTSLLRVGVVALAAVQCWNACQARRLGGSMAIWG